MKRIWQLIVSTFTIWEESKASRMSAALTYYAMLSLAPLLMIAIAIAGYVYDDQVAQAEVLEQVEMVTSPAIKDQVGRLIKNAVHPGSGILAGTISLCIFVFAASGVFTQIYETFNDIWGISNPNKRGVLFTLQKRMLGVGMVLIVGVMLTAALVLNSAVTYLSTLAEGYPTIEMWIGLADRGLSFLLMPLVFSLMFWFFPATKIKWSDVWPAGILTALLIGASRYLIGAYLKFSTTSEVYGVSGSLVVLLIWIYMIGMVVFFGASFSHAWAITFGSRSESARPVSSSELSTGENNLEDHQTSEPLVNELPERNSKSDFLCDEPSPLKPTRRSPIR